MYFCIVKTSKKNKIMKKAILIVSIITLVAWCFFAAATAAPTTAAEITTVCFLELLVLSLPIIAITIITKFVD